MISPTLADQLGWQSLHAAQPRRSNSVVESQACKLNRGINEELPTLIECDNIPKNKRKIPTSELAKRYGHLRDIANEIPPIDPNAKTQLFYRSE